MPKKGKGAGQGANSEQDHAATLIGPEITKAASQDQVADAPVIRKRLPNRRASTVICYDADGHHYRTSGSRFADGRLAEVFVDTGKAGSAVQVQADDAAVLVSLLLQHGIPLDQIQHSVHGPIARALDLLAGSK